MEIIISGEVNRNEIWPATKKATEQTDMIRTLKDED